jgi:hypothetical protein
MKLQQLSLFLENRPGRLWAPCEVLAEKGISIATLSVADTEQFGIMRLIVRDWARAKKVLETNGWVVNLTEVLAVEVEDRPGGLAEVLKVMEEAGLSIEYLYPYTYRRDHRAVVVFRFDDPDAALAALEERGLRVVDDVELYATDA